MTNNPEDQELIEKMAKALGRQLCESDQDFVDCWNEDHWKVTWMQQAETIFEIVEPIITQRQTEKVLRDMARSVLAPGDVVYWDRLRRVALEKYGITLP